MKDARNPNRFNLALGDIDLISGNLEFNELSGNGDAKKVYLTVGDIVQVYTNLHPEREIFVTGNTDEKKRNYSLMTSRYLEEIEVYFEVWGAYQNGELEPFLKEKIYDAILVKRK